MADGLDSATNIACISILGYQFERDLLTSTTDQQGNMWLLHALGLIDCSIYVIVLALEYGLVLRPHCQDDLNGFAQVTQALWSIRIVISIGTIFVLVPTS